MPEVIHNYIAPIAVIPPQSILMGRIEELRRKINKTRKKEAKEILESQKQVLEIQLATLLKSLGR